MSIAFRLYTPSAIMGLEMNTEPAQGTEGRVGVDAGLGAGRRLY